MHQQNPPASDAQPIFQRNIPCPHCGYNLRGLSEPLCPECGEPFDPVEAEKRPRSMAVLQAAGLIWRHPVRFWKMLETPPHETPSWAWRARMSVFVGALVPILPLTLVMLGSRPIRDPGRLPAWFAVCWFIVALAVVILMECHRLVCYLRLHSSVGNWKPASRIAGFSQAWAVLALTPVLMIYFDYMQIDGIHTGMKRYGGSMRPHWFANLQAGWLRMRFELIGVTLACIPWIITIYAGTMRVRPTGRRAVAAYCALCNPLLWASILLVAFSLYRVIPFLRQVGIL